MLDVICRIEVTEDGSEGMSLAFISASVCVCRFVGEMKVIRRGMRRYRSGRSRKMSVIRGRVGMYLYHVAPGLLFIATSFLFSLAEDEMVVG